jgi:hypothetical protein
VKKIIVGFFTSVIAFTPFLALAAPSLSASPTSSVSGSEGSVNISFSGFPYTGLYLFDPSGNAISPSTACVSSGITSPQPWSGLNFPTGNSAGTYTIAEAGWTTNCGNVAYFNSVCSNTGGNTLSSCMAAIAGSGYTNATTSISFVITGGGGGGGGSSTPISALNSSTYLNWSNILFVKTSETYGVSATDTITETYDPMNLYWVLLTAIIVISYATSCVVWWIYD